MSNNKQFYPHIVLAVSKEGVTSFAFITGSSKKGYVYLTKFMEIDDVISAFYVFGVRNLIPLPSNTFTLKGSYESFKVVDSASRFKDREFVCARWATFVDLLNKRWDRKYPRQKNLASSLIGWFIDSFLSHIKLGFMGHEVSPEPFMSYEKFRRCKIATVTDTGALVAVIDLILSQLSGRAKNCYVRATEIERRQRRRIALLTNVSTLTRDHGWTLRLRNGEKVSVGSLDQGETVYLLDMLNDGVDPDRGEEFGRFRRLRNLRDAKDRLINYAPGNELLDAWIEAYVH